MEVSGLLETLTGPIVMWSGHACALCGLFVGSLWALCGLFADRAMRYVC